MDALLRRDPLPLADRPWWRRCLLWSVPSVSCRRFDEGAVVRLEGTPSERLYFIHDGAVALSTTSPAGRRTCLAVLGPGDLFGHEALLCGTSDHAGDPRPVHPEARAVVRSRVHSLTTADFASAIRSDPAIVAPALGALARVAGSLSRRLEQALSLPTPARILALLEDLASAFGRPLEWGIQIDVPLTQEDLAALVGATRETVNRAVRSLERKGLVERTGRHYVLAAPGQGPEAPRS
jgi:CRP/FNR family transcriptional regulator, cyclic AMP receptor protein